MIKFAPYTNESHKIHIIRASRCTGICRRTCNCGGRCGYRDASAPGDGGGQVGGRHERRGLAAAVRFSFPARPPPRRWPRVAGRMGGPGPGWVGVFCWACFHLWFIFPCVVIRFCYDSNSRLTTFPSSSNVSPLSVASSPAWARAWQFRQSNSRLSSLSAISGLLR